MFRKLSRAGCDGMDWFNLGSLRSLRGNCKRAKPPLLKGLEVTCNLMEIHWNLSSVYFSLNQRGDCIRECKRVIEQQSGNVGSVVLTRSVHIVSVIKTSAALFLDHLN